MSRGPGRTQMKVLEYFVDHDCGEEETTVIVQYVQNKSKKPIPTARNIKRAIDGLNRQGWVKKKKDKKIDVGKTYEKYRKFCSDFCGNAFGNCSNNQLSKGKLKLKDLFFGVERDTGIIS